MTTAAESAAAGTGNTPLAASLAEGVASLSGGQIITFSLYVRTVLPVSGFVFWVRAGLIVPGSALYNAFLFNTTAYDATGSGTPPAITLNAPGSLHLSTTQNQDEASSAATNAVVFTSKVPVEPLNEANPNFVWLASFKGRRFAFRESLMHYAQSALWHYRGNAVFSTMGTQIVDSLADLAGLEPIVSNSLPIWLTLNQPPSGYVPVYPSFAVPPNLPPPYIAVHIPPEATMALQSVPLIDRTGTSWQLARDRVKFTLYGIQNNAAIDYQNYLFNATLVDDPDWGLMSMPIWRDEKQTQVELQILAQKKTFEMEVSYYQSRVQDVARQYIKSALVQFTVADVLLAV